MQLINIYYQVILTSLYHYQVFNAVQLYYVNCITLLSKFTESQVWL